MVDQLLQRHGETRPETGARGRGVRTVAIVVALVAASLLAMALPRTFAALVVPSDGSVPEAGTVEPDELQGLLNRERLALGAARDPRSADRAAAIEIALAHAEGIRDAAGRARLDTAIELARDSLAGAPAQPRAWERLGYALIVRDGPSRAAADAVGMSLLTGYEQPLHARSRLSLALLAWNEFRPDDRAAAERLIRDLWLDDPRLVVDFAGRYRAEAAVRGVLAAWGLSLADFDALSSEVSRP